MKYLYNWYLSAQLSMKPGALDETDTIETKNRFSLVDNSLREVDEFILTKLMLIISRSTDLCSLKLFSHKLVFNTSTLAGSD